MMSAVVAQNPVVRELGCTAGSASGTAYTCSIPVAPTGYATTVKYWLVSDVANTGAATVNFNGLGAKTIKKVAGGVTTDLTASDIQAGQYVWLAYDGTNMQMLSQLGNTFTYALPTPTASTMGGVESIDCTGTGHMLKISTAGVPSCSADSGGGASDETTINTVEEFWPTSNSSNAVGALGWGVGGTVTTIAGEVGHPGMYHLATTAVANGTTYLSVSGTSGMRPLPPLNATAGWSIVFIFRTGADNTEVKYRIGNGSTGAPTEAPQSSGVFLEFYSDVANTCTTNGTNDTNWMFVTGSGALTRTIGPAIAVNTWYKVRFRSTVAGTIGTSVAVNGGAYGAENSVSTSLPSIALVPQFAVVTCNTTAKTLDADYWWYYQTGAVR